MLEKKSEPPAGIEPTTFHIPVGRSNNLAMVDSYGEQVAGLGVTTVLRISRVRWTKFLVPSVYVDYTINTYCRKSKDNENDLKAHKKNARELQNKKKREKSNARPVENMSIAGLKHLLKVKELLSFQKQLVNLYSTIATQNHTTASQQTCRTSNIRARSVIVLATAAMGVNAAAYDGRLPKPKQQFFVEKKPPHGISNHLDYSCAY